MSVEEAGKYLSVSPWTVRGLTWSGRLACVRIGRRVLYDLEDLSRFVAAHKHREQP